MNGEPEPGLQELLTAPEAQLPNAPGMTMLVRSNVTTPPGSVDCTVSNPTSGVATPAGRFLMVSAAVDPETKIGSVPDTESCTLVGAHGPAAPDQLIHTVLTPTTVPGMLLRLSTPPPPNGMLVAKMLAGAIAIAVKAIAVNVNL